MLLTVFPESRMFPFPFPSQNALLRKDFEYSGVRSRTAVTIPEVRDIFFVLK